MLSFWQFCLTKSGSPIKSIFCRLLKICFLLANSLEYAFVFKNPQNMCYTKSTYMVVNIQFQYLKIKTRFNFLTGKSFINKYPPLRNDKTSLPTSAFYLMTNLCKSSFGNLKRQFGFASEYNFLTSYLIPVLINVSFPKI